MKHTKRKKNETKRHALLLPVFLVAVVALIFTAQTASAGHHHHRHHGPEVVEFEDAKIIIETNFTAGDAGIQVFLDGEPWKKIQIKDPDGKKIFEVTGKGSLRNFGLTELFSESNEPNFDEDMSLLEILDLFPEGDYEFKGQTVENDKLTGTATFSHDIPCGPANLSPDDGDVVSSAAPLDISWDAVATTLNSDGDDCTMDPITVETYQVIVENVDTGNEFSIFLPATAGTTVTVPTAFVEADTTYKYEVLAIADNGNQTISERYFCTDLECDNPED